MEYYRSFTNIDAKIVNKCLQHLKITAALEAAGECTKMTQISNNAAYDVSSFYVSLPHM